MHAARAASLSQWVRRSSASNAGASATRARALANVARCPPWAAASRNASTPSAAGVAVTRLASAACPLCRGPRSSAITRLAGESSSSTAARTTSPVSRSLPGRSRPTSNALTTACSMSARSRHTWA